MTKLNRFIAVLCLVAGFSLPLPATEASNVCLDDYYSTIFSIRNPEMRRAYFEDFFTMTECQLNDVLPLYEQYESIKDQFRNDAAHCGTVDNYDSKIFGYEQDMKQILLEVYFIRNLRRTASKEVIERTEDMILGNLYDEMKLLFVDGEYPMIGKRQFDNLFGEWSKKYSDKIVNYAYCEDGALGELSESWTDFTQTIKGLKIEVEKPKRQSFKDVITPDSDVSVFPNLVDAGKAFFDKFRQKEDEQVEEARPTPSTFSEYLDYLDDAGDDDDTMTASHRRMAEYELLYGEVSAQATTDIVGALAGINQILIENNTQDFPTIRDNLGEIYGKQCK